MNLISVYDSGIYQIKERLRIEPGFIRLKFSVFVNITATARLRKMVVPR